MSDSCKCFLFSYKMLKYIIAMWWARSLLTGCHRFIIYNLYSPTPQPPEWFCCGKELDFLGKNAPSSVGFAGCGRFSCPKSEPKRCWQLWHLPSLGATSVQTEGCSYPSDFESDSQQPAEPSGRSGHSSDQEMDFLATRSEEVLGLMVDELLDWEFWGEMTKEWLNCFFMFLSKLSPFNVRSSSVFLSCASWFVGDDLLTSSDTNWVTPDVPLCMDSDTWPMTTNQFSCQIIMFQ